VHQEGSSPNRRGFVDPRVERSKAAVIAAATDLWVESGPGAVTIEAIVERSGVAKTTFYRHWPSRDAVMLDVVRSAAPTMTAPDPDLAFEPALRMFVSSFAVTFTDPKWGRLLPALLMLKEYEPVLFEFEESLRRRDVDVLTSVVQRGIDEGVLDSTIDLQLCATHIIGPFLFAHLSRDVDIDERLADDIVDRFIAAHCARS
jgi:AcrR family transcriptional regulator